MQQLQSLANQIEGTLHTGSLLRSLYATDASVYRQLPLGVVYPKHRQDVQTIVQFAAEHKIPLIPRAAGTSLAGQCVGEGLVVDISRHMTQIIELNTKDRWVRVHPGVIRDELNRYLLPHGLFFGPNTSTANRCMMGGMVGNNSCGSTSIVYGSTREHLLEVEAVLSDGSLATFKTTSPAEFDEKCRQEDLEGNLYRQIRQALSDPAQRAEIEAQYPAPSIHRRNTGYAIDLLLQNAPFTEGGPDFNFCRLIAGSEGTLAFITEIKINVVPLPPPEAVLVAAHFSSIDETMRAVVSIMQHQPDACELMDRIILDCTKENRGQRKNRFFLEGDPAGILLVEFRAASRSEAETRADRLIAALSEEQLGYAYPKIFPPQIDNVWNLRKAGLGLLANIPGDAKAVACIEDTAVAIQHLPEYIHEFSEMMAAFGQEAVYYAHAGAGEIHLRPILDLKTEAGVRDFRAIGQATAKLVKKYKGSLSGEHGDGRVRAEFIPQMIGDKNYQLLREIKQTWDPQNIFNPGKIVDAPPMDADLRYETGQPPPGWDTVLDFSHNGGFLRAAEKCNGSGDCRKLHFADGGMCPSYHATREEKDATRARANALREFLTQGQDRPNPFAREELKEVLDLCLSCKACASECPSNVDMAGMKAEFLHQYYREKGIPLRAKIFGNIDRINRLSVRLTGPANFFFRNGLSSGLLKRMMGVAPQRSLPPLHSPTLRKWYERNGQKLQTRRPDKGKVFLFCDEFTNYNDVPIGQKAVQLLTRLGYDVEIPPHVSSGRAAISKGLLPRARDLARENVRLLKDLISADTPLVGIEPSAILSFRDEYPRLVDAAEVAAANKLGENALLIEEFLAREIEAGRITPDAFTREKKKVILHGHCHQKALASVDPSAWVLGLPENYEVEVLPTGCCGMAGSFGYEREHYEVSQKVGELILFPAVRKSSNDTIIAAPGTSCRHQILDGTGRKALHPVEVLFEALREWQ
jgi:FAD/FMN-containing dehydrogenase/Fe-S oxidoreductase